VISWKPRERRPVFEVARVRRASPKIARRRTQYGVNFFLTDLLTYWLTDYGTYFSPPSHRNQKVLTLFDSLNVFLCTQVFWSK
jgi:hypothetical protein